MPSILIRNVDEALHQRLKSSAATHRRSLEEEARELLRTALARQGSSRDENVAEIVERLFGDDREDFDLEIPARGRTPKRPPPFSDQP